MQQIISFTGTVLFTLQLLVNILHGAYSDGLMIGQEPPLNKIGKHLESGQTNIEFVPQITFKNISILRDDLALKDAKTNNKTRQYIQHDHFSTSANATIMADHKSTKDLLISVGLETDIQSRRKVLRKLKFIGQNKLNPKDPEDADSSNQRLPTKNKRIVRNVPSFQNDDLLSVVDSAYAKRASQQQLRRKKHPIRRTFVGTLTGNPTIAIGLGLTSLFGGTIWAGSKFFSPWFVGPPGPPGPLGPPGPIGLPGAPATTAATTTTTAAGPAGPAGPPEGGR